MADVNMTEADAAAKPAEAAQAPPPAGEDKPQPADGSELVGVKTGPEAKSESAEEKPGPDVEAEPAGEKPGPDVEAEPAGQKPEPEVTAESAEGPASVPGNVEAEERKPEAAEGKPAKDDDTKMLKTKAKHDQANPRNNRKFDPSTREVTDDPVSIRKQVEFYFGDWNFPQDKFMWESCEGAANKPMPISTIHSFKRMRAFQPYSAVVASLRGSEFLEVAGEEGKETVRRKVAYKPMAEGKAKIEAATVYVKGFGDENSDTQFDLESFFGKFGEIKGLKLRRTNEGLFKGSVFVTFPDEEAAKKFVAMDPSPTFKGHELKIMTKRDYCDEKSELIRQGKLEPNSTSQKKFFEGRDPSRKSFRGKDHHRGTRDPDDWKKRREQDQKRGFQDRRGGGRGRGGRGRGRGWGRGGRGGRGGYDGSRDGDGQREHGERRDDSNNAKPRIQSTAEETKDAAAATNGKRAREDDGGEGAPAAKKVDSKEEASASAS